MGIIGPRAPFKRTFSKLSKNNPICAWKDFLKGKADIIAPMHGQTNIAEFVSSQEFERSKKLLRVSGMMITIKTWANSWYTSSRMGEKTTSSCIFGCACYQGCEKDPKDKLEHYLRCNILWKLIAATIEGAEYREHLSPVQKACLYGPAHNDLKILCVAFKTYHALKMGHSELIQKAVRSEQFDRVHEFLLDYLRCFTLESSLHLHAS